MLEKTLGDITEDDIQELVDDSVEESKELEYKQYLDPSNKDKHKTSLLAEVTSFANSRGGDLIVGISENNGVPQNLGGIPLNKSADKTVETWGNILRRQTEPKLPTNIHDIRAISLSNGNHAIIVRVNRSWQAPHRVRTNDRFYGRHASGKFPMTVGEIRDQIVAGESRKQDLEEFRADRISEIISGNSPVPVTDGPKLLFHLVPYDAFTPGDNIDLSAASCLSESSPVMFSPRGISGGWGDRFMVDSVTQYTGERQSQHSSYVRTFKNGAIEAYTSVPFSSYNTESEGLPSFPIYADGEIQYLLAEFVESSFERALPNYIDFINEQGMQPPLYLLLTVLNAGEYTFISEEQGIPMDPISFDVEVLQIPSEVIESFDDDHGPVISSIMNSLWNAAGRRDSEDI
jgi:hypothetical protein